MQLTFKTMGKELRASQRRPKPNSPHYCTDQRPCEQITHSTQRVQSSPFYNRRTLLPKQVTDITPRTSQVITHTPQVDPWSLSGTVPACRRVPPIYRLGCQIDRQIEIEIEMSISIDVELDRRTSISGFDICMCMESMSCVCSADRIRKSKLDRSNSIESRYQTRFARCPVGFNF